MKGDRQRPRRSTRPRIMVCGQFHPGEVDPGGETNDFNGRWGGQEDRVGAFPLGGKRLWI